MEIKELLKYTLDSGASDLHLSVGSIPSIRLNGEIKNLKLPIMDSATMEGISKDITFNLECNKHCNLSISVPLESLDSGNDSRDSNMLYYTESILYPIVSFKSEEFHFLEDFNSTINVSGIIDFHGISIPTQVKIILQETENGIWGTSDFSIGLDSFGVQKPSLLMIRISDIITIESKFKIIEESSFSQ